VRIWADPDTGEIIGWRESAGKQRFRGVRTYLFPVEETELEGAIVRHTIGPASLLLANGTNISETRWGPEEPRRPPLGSRWVTCDDAGVPIANELA
jgi:hypothetical protein